MVPFPNLDNNSAKNWIRATETVMDFWDKLQN